MADVDVANQPAPDGPLHGLRVLDFSRVLSGPHCTRALADLGAMVIKVEPPDGDIARSIPPRSNQMSGFFAQQNAGKQNISLDLTSAAARDLIHRLIPSIDVVVENFRPGIMARMEMDYATLSAINPRLVYGSISGWGQSGPDNQRRAYAVVVQAESGISARSISMHADDRAQNEPFSLGDILAGVDCLSGILAALYQRERTGRGQHVDVSMMGSLLAMNEHVQAELSPNWTRATEAGSPIFRLGDELVTLSGDPCLDGTFDLYLRAMGRADLAADSRFDSAPARYANRRDLLAEIQEWVDRFSSVEELEAAVDSIRFAVGVVRSVAQAAETEWVAARGAITEVSDRAGGTIRIPNARWRFSDAFAGVRGDPAWRGENNREVLTELGVSVEEIELLERDGVLSSRLPEASRPAVRRESTAPGSVTRRSQ